MRLNENVLKEAMDARLMERRELALMLGVSVVTVGNWLNGRTEPRLKSVKLIAEKLKINPKKLTTRSTKND